MKKELVVTAEMKQMLRDSVNVDLHIAHQAKMALSAALTLPLKQGVMPGDTISGIFEEEQFEPGIAPEYPLDPVSPGTEKYYVAFTVPNTGRIPEFHIEGDYIMVPTYEIATALDWSRKYARDARWPVVGRAMRVANSSMQRKKNNDGWHVIMAAAVNRGLQVFDDQATAGLFTKRLIALGKTIMRRNSGGNSTSVNQGKLTHVALSPEGLEDIRSWDLTQVDDITRREIFISGEGEMSLTRIFGVTLIDLDELGVGQEYQKYLQNVLSATLSGSKLEFAVGLDRSTSDSFVMPWRVQPNGERVEMMDRPSLLEQNRTGFTWREEVGFAQLDSRRSLILSF